MDQIVTERLLLRKFKDEDLSILYAYRNNENCSKYQMWEDTSLEYLRGFINEEKVREIADGDVQLAIASRATDELFGDVYIAIKERTITLGYTISPENQRKGYAFEMISALIKDLKKEYHGYEIVGLVHPDNFASIKMLEKLGFANEGYEEKLDSIIFSLQEVRPMKVNIELIAPCGMNCSICMAYLRKKNKCNGCRALNKWNPKTRVECKIKNCSGLKVPGRKFCYECENYPCKLLKHMDVRYKTKYKMSVIENLEAIKKDGVEALLAAEAEKWKCKYCGGVICVHKGICSDCGK